MPVLQHICWEWGSWKDFWFDELVYKGSAERTVKKSDEWESTKDWTGVKPSVCYICSSAACKGLQFSCWLSVLPFIWVRRPLGILGMIYQELFIMWCINLGSEYPLDRGMRVDKAFQRTLYCPCICPIGWRCYMSSCPSSVCSSAPYVLCSYCHLKISGVIVHTAVIVILKYLSWGTFSKAREATGHQSPPASLQEPWQHHQTVHLVFSRKTSHVLWRDVSAA